MARCGCASDVCSCALAGGNGIVISGIGTLANPYLISFSGFAQTNLTVDDTDSLDLTLVGNGTVDNPYVITGEATAIVPIDTAEPVGTVAGETYFNEDEDRLYVFDGTEWLPAEPAKPMVHLRRAAAQPLTNLALTAISWDTEVQDSSSMWTSGTNVTIAETGRYTITSKGSIGVPALTDGVLYGSVKVNGIELTSPFRIGTRATDGVIAVSGVTELDLVAGDVLTLSLLQNTGADRNTFTGIYSPEFIVRKVA